MTGRRASRFAVTLAATIAAALPLSAPGQVSADPADAEWGNLATASAETRALVEWNVVALRTTAAAPFDPPLESRNVALVQTAVYDAVRSIRGGYRPYAVTVRTGRHASVVAAVAAAAYRTLVTLYPAQAEVLDQDLETSLAGVPDGHSEREGVRVGEAAATALLALRSHDHASDSVTYTPGSGPGAWVPTPPALRPALDPGWGLVTPYFLRTGSQFRPGPPPALTSATYARDLAEITVIGSASSTTRTAAQTDLARFWVATAPQVWNQAAQQLTLERRLGVTRAARLFALLNAAGADAFIVSWDAKFAYGQWRPVTAIPAADTDGNDATAPDPAWTPLLTTPPFPDYPAGHATYAGAAETVLASVFGAHPGPFTLRSATAPGVELGYQNFVDAAADVVDARVWGGIHWRTSAEVGRRLGRQVARYALRHGLRPALRPGRAHSPQNGPERPTLRR